MTQVMADVVALPVAWGGVHLYAGGGFIMNLTHHAEITDVIANPNIEQQVQQNLNEVKDGIQSNLLVGVHAQLKRTAMFGNLIWMPTPSNFILNGKSAYFLEAGLRFNFGTSRKATSRPRTWDGSAGTARDEKRRREPDRAAAFASPDVQRVSSTNCFDRIHMMNSGDRQDGSPLLFIRLCNMFILSGSSLV